MRTSGSQLLTLLLAGAVLAGCSESTTPGPTGPSSVASAAKNPRSSGYIVIMKKGANLSRIRPGARLNNVIGLHNAAAADNAVVTELVPSIGGVVVAGAANAASLEGDDVAAVVPNYEADIIDPTPAPFDAVALADPNPAPVGTDQSGAAFFANNTQWGFKKISANRVWVPSRGGAGAKVCITDSGIDAGHVAFATKSIMSASFIANSAAQTDTNGHGSHVAGTVSTNGQGGASVAPDATLMTAKIFNGAGGGAVTSVVLNAVAWCADNGADVINMSIGFTGGVPIAGNEAFIAAYEAGLDYATSRGVLIVAAAGNDGMTLPVAGRIFLPAEAPGVTSVAANALTTNLGPFGANPTWQSPGAAFDGIASYSNRGPMPSVDLSAPGGDLFSGWPVQSLIISVCSRQFRSGTSFPCAANGFWLYNAGTSMASPHVAGVAALIRARWPGVARSTAFRQKIENCLYRSVDNIGSTGTFGRGRVNAYKAVTQPC
jgi:subtilisin family serine protease